MTEHEKYMHRCLQLAVLAHGNTSPNPMVGSVIVHRGKIIGEGYHRKVGLAHAEVNAVASVQNPDLLKESTLYVNLEPCAHQGRTPACSRLIIEKRIPRVVIGTIDPFALVAGKGIEMLREAGVEVTVGILEKESRELNKRFFTFHQKKRPFIILKWAQTLDGYIDKIRYKDDPIQPNWITNRLSRRLVHKWRAQEDAIMVGTNTAEYDNPKLNIREWTGTPPLRIVLDRNLRLSPLLHLFDASIPTLVFTQKNNSSCTENLEYFQLNFSNSVLPQVLDELHKRDIQSVIIEGGAQLITSFIAANLWDEARVFTGNRFFGTGIAAPKINAIPVSEENLKGSWLNFYTNTTNT